MGAPGEGRKAISPGELFAALTRFGHRAPDLTGYTLRQLELYYSWGIKLEARALAEKMEAQRMAHWGKAAQFTDAIAKLRGA